MLVVQRADLSDPHIIALLAHHVTRARVASPPGSAHALDLPAMTLPLPT